jgi:hypothetical protein
VKNKEDQSAFFVEEERKEEGKTKKRLTNDKLPNRR